MMEGGFVKQTVCLPLRFVFMLLWFAAKKGLFREITEAAEKNGIRMEQETPHHNRAVFQAVDKVSTA
jgi:hypothetical protein